MEKPHDFEPLLRDPERLVHSPRPNPKVSVLMKKPKPLAKAMPKHRSVTVLLKSGPVQPPTFVWHGHTPRVALQPGIVIEGEPR